MLPCFCILFLCWVKFCSGCFPQFFFHFGDKKVVFLHSNNWSLVTLGRWLSYTETTVWEFTWMDLPFAVLDEWSSYRGGRLNRFYYSI